MEKYKSDKPMTDGLSYTVLNCQNICIYDIMIDPRYKKDPSRILEEKQNSDRPDLVSDPTYVPTGKFTLKFCVWLKTKFTPRF